MIRHIVILRWADGTPSEAVAALSEVLAGLPEQIPVLQGYWYGPDLGLREGNADYGIVAELGSEQDWRAYLEHPAHLDVIASHIAPIVAERAAVQIRS